MTGQRMKGLGSAEEAEHPVWRGTPSLKLSPLQDTHADFSRKNPVPLGHSRRGLSEGVDAPMSIIQLGRKSDRVWLSCHQISMTLTQPITSARIASLREPKDQAHQGLQIPQKGIKSHLPLSSWFFRTVYGNCHSHGPLCLRHHLSM